VIRVTLKALTDSELLSRVEALTQRERATTIDILLHLGEVERRRLHLSLGYRSLFDYCTQHLKYSASAAGRRIQTARCIRRHPEVHELLVRREVNMSTISHVAPVLTTDNKDELLRSIRHKSQRHVEAIVSRFRPPLSLRDRVRPVCVRVPDSTYVDGGRRGADGDARWGGGTLQATEYQNEGTGTPKHSRCGSEGDAGQDADGTGISEHSRGGSGGPTTPGQIEQKLLIQFLASEAFMKKYEEVRSLLSNRLGRTSFENVFGVLIEEFLGRHSPRMRMERRKRRLAKVLEGSAIRTRNSGRSPDKTAQASRHQRPVKTLQACSRTRHIRASVRDEVLVRDSGSCAFVSPDGKRCSSTHKPQVDHVKPFAKGGANKASNLRVLCADHNRWVAEQVYGTEFMNHFWPRE